LGTPRGSTTNQLPSCRVNLGRLNLGRLVAKELEPVDGSFVVSDEILVGAAEGFGAEESSGREGRGVRAFDDEVLRTVDVRAFGFGVVAPENEDEILALLGEFADDGVGEFFPSLPLMRASSAGAHGERRIHEEYALLGPVFKTAALLRQGFEGQRAIC